MHQDQMKRALQCASLKTNQLKVLSNPHHQALTHHQERPQKPIDELDNKLISLHAKQGLKPLKVPIMECRKIIMTSIQTPRVNTSKEIP